MNAICKPKGFKAMTKRTPAQLSSITSDCLLQVLDRRPDNSNWQDSDGRDPIEQRMRRLVTYCLAGPTNNPEAGREVA